MIIQYGIMNKLTGKSFFSGAPGSGGNDPVQKPITKKKSNIKMDGGKGMSGMTDAISKIDAKKYSQVELHLYQQQVFVFAKAVQEFMKVGMESYWYVALKMMAFSLGIGILVGALALVGAIMMSGVGAVCDSRRCSRNV